MPFIAINLKVTPHVLQGWATTLQALQALYPGSQIITVNRRVVQMIELGSGLEGLELSYDGNWYRTVLGYSAPATRGRGPKMFGKQLPNILNSLTVSTSTRARDVVRNIVLAWTGDIEVTAESVTFSNTDSDPNMDAIMQAVLSRPYIVANYYVDEGIAGQYTFLRAPR